MKKNLIILCLITVSSLAHSQVGINTPNPQGTFHVDGAKDNAETGTPTLAQQANDFTVTSTGNVGVGTTAPSAKLDVVGNIKITDGTEGDGKVLVSGINGIASWQTSTATKSLVLATMGLGANISTGGLAVQTGSFLTLGPGRWLVMTTQLVNLTSMSGGWFNVRSTFSDSSMSTSISPDIVTNGTQGRWISGIMNSGTRWHVMNGSLIINNTSGADKTYYYYAFTDTTGTVDTFGGSWSENQLYALPIN